MDNYMDYKVGIYIESFNKGTGAMQAANDINKVNQAAKSASSGGLANYGKSLQSLGSRINVLGQRMTWMVTVPLLAFGKKSVDTYLSVAESFLRLEKVFQGTVEDINKIKDAAFDLSTKFGKPVEEITEIMVNFNKAGIDSAEDLKNLADIVTQTGIMFDVDLSTATEGITSLMFGFKLSVEETRQALADINLIADTTTASEAGVLEVMTKVAGIARNAGASIREVAAAQAIFGANAIPAGRAGNALKAMFVALDKTSNEARKQFNALGLDMTSAEWKTSSWTEKIQKLKDLFEKVKATGDKQIFDKFIKDVDKATKQSEDFDYSQTNVIEKLNMLRVALVKAQREGDTNTFNEISEKLRLLGLAGNDPIEKISDLDYKIKILTASGNTEALAELNEAMGSGFGKFQISNMYAILDGWDDFNKIMEETKDPALAAERWAKGMKAYLESDVVQMKILNEEYRKQSFEIGKKLFPIYEKLIDFLGKVLEKFNNLSPETQDWIIKLGLLAVVLGPFASATGLLMTIVGFLGQMGGAIIGLGKGAGLSVVAGNFGLMAVALLAIAAAWAIVKPAYDELQKTLESGKKTWEDNNKKIDDYKSKIGTLKTDKANEQLKNATDAVQKHNNELKTMNERYAGLPGVWNAIKDQFAPFINWWKERWDSVKLIFDGVWNLIMGALKVTMGIMQVLIGLFLTIILGQWKVGWELIKTGFKVIWDGIGTMLKGSLEVWFGLVGTFFNNLGKELNNLIDKFNKLPSWMRAGKTIDIRFNVGTTESKKSISKAFSNMSNFGGIIHAASGYLARGRDTVPAMLSPGEMVLNKSQQTNLFDILSGRMQAQTAGGPTVNINVGTMIASRGEQREFARRITELWEENFNRK